MPRPPMLALAAIFAGAFTTAAAQTPLTVGPVTAKPGEKVSGFIEIPAAKDSGTRIPITVIRGRAAGPTLALVAGTHGSEVAPILALQRVRALVDPARLRGSLILVHVANLPSFLNRTIYRGPWDAKNLNRVYPGKQDGTVSERIAYAITNEVIAKTDYLVDVHAGDGNESLRPYTYWPRIGVDARVDSVAGQMALAWGNDHIVIDTARPKDPAASIYTQTTAHLRGKPALTTESGWLGVPAEEMIARNVDGALRLMTFLGMLPGPVQLVRNPVWLDRTQVITSPETGVWIPRVERGQTVGGGAPLGHLLNFFGDTIATVTAPFSGIVLYVVGTPAMSKGEPVGMVAAFPRN